MCQPEAQIYDAKIWFVIIFWSFSSLNVAQKILSIWSLCTLNITKDNLDDALLASFFKTTICGVLKDSICQRLVDR